MPTPSLRELQQSFWRGITRDVEAGPLAVIAPSAALAPADRLRIYSGMYASRLVDALRESFPSTAAVLGQERFGELVRVYLGRHPSVHPSIRHVGRRLPAFLAAADAPGFVADLARLEWLRLEVFDAPDTPVLRREDLAAVPPEDWPGLRFEAVAGLQTLVARWPVHRLWKEPERGTCDRERTALRVWRDGFVVYQSPMEPDEEGALRRLVGGECFAVICDAFEDPAAPAALLLRWIEDGIVARVV